MDDPNIIMEEYIRLEEEQARRSGKVYNWETVTYGKILYDNDVHDLRPVKIKFPSIVFNDELTSEEALSCEPTVSPLPDHEIDFRISFDESDDEDYTVIFDKNSFSYKIIYVNNLNTYSENDIDKADVPSFPSPEPTRHLYLRFEGLEYTDANIAYFEMRLVRSITERFGEAILDIDAAGTLQVQLGGAKRRMSWREIILALGLHTTREMQTAIFGLYWTESARQISDKGDLSAYWMGISSEGDFLGTPLSYNLIRDPMLRGMDVGSFNIPYLLARYLRRFDSTRKQRGMISRGQFTARLAEHFRLLTEERLQGLIVIVRELHVIDMAELERLQICCFSTRTGTPATTCCRASSDHGLEISDSVGGGATYVWYSKTHVPYQRRKVRQRTGDASTLAAPLDEDQPDP
nr:hypothetical protein [Tanacetum cinerariifolium]